MENIEIISTILGIIAGMSVGIFLVLCDISKEIFRIRKMLEEERKMRVEKMKKEYIETGKITD